MLQIKLRLFLIFFSAIIPLWGESCTLSLSSANINPAPMTYLGDANGSFNIVSGGGRPVPLDNGEGGVNCIIEVTLNNTELKENDVNLVIGTVNTYFTINYSVPNNMLTLTQKVEIPADTEIDLTIPLEVTDQSNADNAQNGFVAEITTNKSSVNEYTYTSSATLLANDDFNNSVNGTIESEVISNIVLNDTINGKVVTLNSDINITTVTNNTPLSINKNTGSVTVLAGTAEGTYVETYTICETYDINNCSNGTVTVIVDALILPDYTPKIRLTGASTTGEDTLVPVILTLTEIKGGINTDDITVRIPKHDYISFVYDSNMTVLKGKSVNNTDWLLVGHPAEYRFTYIGSDKSFASSSFSRIGLEVRVLPVQGTSGTIDFGIEIKPGNGDENALNDADNAQIDYVN